MHLAPVNYYGETKKLAEAAVQYYPFAWSIVRTILVYGKPISGRQKPFNHGFQCLAEKRNA